MKEVLNMKKGQMIRHECWECYNDEMKIYRVKWNDKIQGHGIIWVECVCGAVDDIIYEYGKQK